MAKDKAATFEKELSAGMSQIKQAFKKLSDEKTDHAEVAALGRAFSKNGEISPDRAFLTKSLRFCLPHALWGTRRSCWARATRLGADNRPEHPAYPPDSGGEGK